MDMAQAERQRVRAGEDRTRKAIEQWELARPDLDISVLRIRTRLSLLGTYAAADNQRIARDHGIRGDDLRVLFALRRTGAPFRMRPTDLFRALLVSSGTMTRLVDRLEAGGLVERIPDPADGRSLLVALTENGLAVVDAAVETAVEGSPISAAARTLTAAERDTLHTLLARLLAELEATGART
jgi:DNA-binding MarR family transcriptional regulator